MPPLPQPEFQTPAQSLQWPVEAVVRLRTQERHQPPGRDVRKTGEPQKVEEEKQLPPADQPIRGARDRVKTYYHYRISPVRRLAAGMVHPGDSPGDFTDRKSTRLNSSHLGISYA